MDQSHWLLDWLWLASNRSYLFCFHTHSHKNDWKITHQKCIFSCCFCYNIFALSGPNHNLDLLLMRIYCKHTRASKKSYLGGKFPGSNVKNLPAAFGGQTIFYPGASSLGTFAIFKLSAPILEGGGTHFTLGSVHFWPFLLRELQGGVKKFSAALPRRHPRVASPPYFFTSGVNRKKFFTQGCTPPLPTPLPMYDRY